MKLATATLLSLILIPSFGLAEGSCHQKMQIEASITCAEGLIFDSQTKTCVKATS